MDIVSSIGFVFLIYSTIAFCVFIGFVVHDLFTNKGCFDGWDRKYLGMGVASLLWIHLLIFYNS